MGALPEHSPLGASGAYRWIPCPGSVGMAKQIPKPESSEYALEGTTAHTVAADCLGNTSDYKEPWQFIGFFNEDTGFPVTPEMSMAVCEFVFPIRDLHGDIDPDNVEHSFHCPEIHKDFHGTADFWGIVGRTLHVWDYKHGAGIAVAVKKNPQTMYYAAGVLHSKHLFDLIDDIELHIIQPRCPFYGGTHRTWSLTIYELEDWLWETLVPAMRRTETDDTLCSGSWCRFCPMISYGCPQMLADLTDFEDIMTIEAKEFSNEALGRFLALGDILKMTVKPALETAYARLSKAKEIPGRKLVSGSANRVWRDGAEEALKEKFGKQAFSKPKLKSPTQIEKLVGGEEEAAKYTFKPNVGLQVVSSEDNRPAVNKDTKSLFKPQKKGRK